MLPFGSTVLLWRLERSWTQAELAKRARVPRPNLSAIERGAREVSLKTIRALALALDVTPGTLVDGIGPAPKAPPWSRNALERISNAVARNQPLTIPHERALARHLSNLTRSHRRSCGGRKGRVRRLGQNGSRAWLRVAAGLPRETLKSLLERIREKTPRVEPSRAVR